VLCKKDGKRLVAKKAYNPESQSWTHPRVSLLTNGLIIGWSH